MFTPESFQFHLIQGECIWESRGTYSQPTGNYLLVKSPYEDDWFELLEILKKNGKEIDRMIYQGRIPSNEFAFELFKNMELLLPVIQRETKIENLLK
jgi:hypothetical protein